MMMTPIDQARSTLCAAVAEEIRSVRLLLEALAEVIVSDERFARDYVDQLQAFDILIQHVDEGADLLDRLARETDPAVAVDHVRLGAMQDRLRAALAGS